MAAVETNHPQQPQLSGPHDACIPIGSFSQDPIGFAAGDANLYRYVGNGPVDSTDPSGLEETWSDWWWSWFSPVSPTDAVDTVYAYGNAHDAGRLNRREQARDLEPIRKLLAALALAAVLFGFRIGS